jgi:predicted permease
LVLASAVPLAADTVAFAALLKCHPEEMASAVVLSSLFALFYIPFIVAVFM